MRMAGGTRDRPGCVIDAQDAFRGRPRGLREIWGILGRKRRDRMNWPDILAMDEAQLNMAIDTHVYGTTWHPVQYGDSDRGDWWQRTDEPGVLVTRSSVPYSHHTASFERAIQLEVTA
jgi:hypothetical protein